MVSPWGARVVIAGLLSIAACAPKPLPPPPRVAVSPPAASVAPGPSVAPWLAPTDVVGESGPDDLVVVDKGATTAVVAVSSKAGPKEKLAAADLAEFIEKMSGARPKVVTGDAAIAAALDGKAPVLVVGQEALRVEPSLAKRLEAAAKKSPILGADAIVLKRAGHRVYVAGNNDDAHAYAVAYLLQRWGCRFFMPTAFGESIPEQPTLKVGAIDFAYGSPLEVRGFWIGWNGSTEGKAEFARRNYFNERRVSGGHALGTYLKDVIPEGKTIFNVPIAGEFPANYVAAQVAPMFAKGQDFALGMEDGAYDVDQRRDLEMRVNVRDKYSLAYSVTDNFMDFYNRVSETLLRQYPNSSSHIGFMAYANATIPPQRGFVAAKPLVLSLAPIDIDPNHSMDDPRAPARQEYRGMLSRWTKVMEGRLFVYDYDQSMIVWRDVPNPSIQAFRNDVKRFVELGILGVDTESRSAIATTFNNLYLRGQLMWNPAADTDALLGDFYARFYGPAAQPMAKYWGAIVSAWERSITTEHQHFALPAIYTPPLVAELRRLLEEGEAALKAAAPRGREYPKIVERMRFTRLGFEVLQGYTSMVAKVATEVDYKSGIEAGERGLAARGELKKMNPTFVNTGMAEVGAAWWPGEVEQYRSIQQSIDGTRGTLLKKLPLEWAFHRDPRDTGLMRGYAYAPVDLRYWTEHAGAQTLESRKDYPTTEWEMLRTDLYAQAQGILHPDWQSYTGYMWYRTDVELDAAEAKGPVRIMFPGMFNEGWLYVNGNLVSYRFFPGKWWVTDFKFQWEADIAAALKPGKNTIAVRLYNPHHFGGIFRRPFLYRPR